MFDSFCRTIQSDLLEGVNVLVPETGGGRDYRPFVPAGQTTRSVERSPA